MLGKSRAGLKEKENKGKGRKVRKKRTDEKMRMKK